MPAALPPETGSLLPAAWEDSAAFPGPVEYAARVQRSIKEILLPLFIQVGTSDTLRADSLGFWRHGEDRFWLPRFVFQRTSTVKQRIKVGLFAGIHGDEPAGILGLIDFVRALDAEPELGREFQLWVYPLCNPTGFVDETRHSRSGLRSEPAILGAIPGAGNPAAGGGTAAAANLTASSPCTPTTRAMACTASCGGHTLTKHLMEPALAAAEAALPRNKREQIDGFHAVEGIIHAGYGGILSAPPDAHPQPFEIVMETPQHAPMELQRQAFVLALKSILAEYRQFISYAADIEQPVARAGRFPPSREKIVSPPERFYLRRSAFPTLYHEDFQTR